MKTTKRTTVTVKTFESMIVRLKQKPPKVFSENCRQPVSELPITKIAFVQSVAETENIYLFVTDSGLGFFLKFCEENIKSILRIRSFFIIKGKFWRQ